MYTACEPGYIYANDAGNVATWPDRTAVATSLWSEELGLKQKQVFRSGRWNAWLLDTPAAPQSFVSLNFASKLREQLCRSMRAASSATRLLQRRYPERFFGLLKDAYCFAIRYEKTATFFFSRGPPTRRPLLDALDPHSLAYDLFTALALAAV